VTLRSAARTARKSRIQLFLRWTIRHGGPRGVLRVMTWAKSPVGRVLFDRAGQEDIFTLHQKIRRRGTITGSSIALATSHHETSGLILRSPLFHAGADSSPIARWAMERGVNPKALGPLDPPSLLVVDPPDHTRYRRLVSKVFTPRAVANLEPEITRITAELLDELVDQPVANIVDAYAKRLPVAVIALMLGIPETMLGQFLIWSDQAVPSLDLGITHHEFKLADQALTETNAWLREHFQHLRENPGPDLLSELVAMVDQGDRLTEEELLATAQLVLAAGFVTIVDMLASGVVLLLRHPAQLASLRADPSGWPNAIEEILRFESPVQLTARFATEKTTIGQRKFSRGQAVIPMLGGANRDPAVFEDPETFDVTRENAKDHLAFSRGIHHCLGSGLARLEGEIALRSLFERFPTLCLAAEPVRRPGAMLRGYEQVLIVPGPARAVPPSPGCTTGRGLQCLSD
jgi:cytochrome P450